MTVAGHTVAVTCVPVPSDTGITGEGGKLCTKRRGQGKINRAEENGESRGQGLPNNNRASDKNKKIKKKNKRKHCGVENKSNKTCVFPSPKAGVLPQCFFLTRARCQDIHHTAKLVHVHGRWLWKWGVFIPGVDFSLGLCEI